MEGGGGVSRDQCIVEIQYCLLLSQAIRLGDFITQGLKKKLAIKMPSMQTGNKLGTNIG